MKNFVRELTIWIFDSERGMRMDGFVADVENIKKVNSEFKKINRKLWFYERNFDYTKRKILSNLPQFIENLKNIGNELEEEIGACHQYAGNLKSIAVLYQKSENNVLAKIFPKSQNESEEDNLALGWLRTIIDNLKPDGETNGPWLGYDFFDFLYSLFGTAGEIGTRDDIGTIGIIGLLLGEIEGVVDVAEHFLEKIHKFYLVIVKSYAEAIGQGLESSDKYSKDGHLSGTDIGLIGIETAVAGLYTMISELMEGFVSEKTTGISDDEISAFIEDACEEAAERIANYFRGH